jgi:sec-independent protein translocase protein TatC
MTNRTVGDIAARDRPRPILEHFSELQRRMTLTAILFALGFVAALVFYEPIIKVLLIPAHGNLSPASTPIVTGLTEFMGVTIKIGIIAGFLVALPMLICQIVLFIAPALSAQTTRLFFSLIPAVLLLFAGGTCLGYFMVVPTMVRFLLGFGSDLVTPMIRLGDYLGIILMLLAGLGLAFQTPVIMFVLAKFRIVSYRGFLRFWRHIIVISFVIGAIFDPTPNPFDQIVVAGCIITLYFIGILIAWFLHRNRAVARIAEDASSYSRSPG